MSAFFLNLLNNHKSHSGEISIRKEISSEGIIEVYNSLGTKLFSEVLPSDAMELKLIFAEWANGVYLLKIKFADGSMSQSTFILSR